MTNWLILVFYMWGNWFFAHCHTISASGETGDNETIDKQGADKLLAALKR